MSASSAASSLQPVARLLGHARYVFGGLLLLTIALLVWQHVGMEEVLELGGGHFSVKVTDDRADGGASQGWVERKGRDLVMHCRIVKKIDWPHCKLSFDFLKGAKGIDMSHFDYMIVDAGYAGPGSVKFGVVMSEVEEGYTRLDTWQTYKVEQVESLDLPSDGHMLIPMNWFVVAQWWKEMAKPPIERSPWCLRGARGWRTG